MNLFTVLGVLFIALKLIGLIDWSWWLVLLPIYGSMAFVIVAGLVALALAVVFKK